MATRCSVRLLRFRFNCTNSGAEKCALLSKENTFTFYSPYFRFVCITIVSISIILAYMCTYLFFNKTSIFVKYIIVNFNGNFIKILLLTVNIIYQKKGIQCVSQRKPNKMGVYALVAVIRNDNVQCCVDQSGSYNFSQVYTICLREL